MDAFPTQIHQRSSGAEKHASLSKSCAAQIRCGQFRCPVGLLVGLSKPQLGRSCLYQIWKNISREIPEIGHMMPYAGSWMAMVPLCRGWDYSNMSFVNFFPVDLLIWGYLIWKWVWTGLLNSWNIATLGLHFRFILDLLIVAMLGAVNEIQCA